MKQNEQRTILKIESKILKKAKWKMTIDEAAATDLKITIGESQLLRWIDEINQRGDVNEEIKEIKKSISKIRKTNTSKTKQRLKVAQKALAKSKFLPELISVVFPACTKDPITGLKTKNPQYEHAATKGFYINGKHYIRLLGTPGGIKQCTVLFCLADIHSELIRRIENSRKPDKQLIAAKLEAYRALTCSGSVPIPAPDGVIVVNDCITKFKEDVVVIRDSEDSDEPILTFEKEYEIEHNNSDGFGLMLPSYAAKINKALTGDTAPISGAVIRYAWCKGLLVPFDFCKFGEQIAHNYIITDVWGTPRDIRKAEIILTESQLKLWDSYDSWEDYQQHCNDNNYQWAVTKVCEKRLEEIRTANYQFLNPYDFTDEEIQQLCAPTVDEIKKIMQLDPNFTILYLTGEKFETEEDYNRVNNTIVKALQIAPEVINDPYIRAHIWNSIFMKIERAKRGKINLNANFAIICGDPYALAQSMFNLPVTGLLSAGEVYHKYWIDKGANEIACFRAPMTNSANIRKLKLAKCNSWFEYIETTCIINAWDSTLEAENGADADGDTFYTTNNPIILKNTENQPTIISIQNKADKTIPTEADIITANKLAFSDEIGEVTNRVTEMIDLRTHFPKYSDEYKILTYRIMCGQHLQQATIDRVKGAKTKSMPKHWYTVGKNTDELTARIAATKKPYFMCYVYPKLKTDYQEIHKFLKINAPKKCVCEYWQLPQSTHPEAQKLLIQYEHLSPVTDYDCVVNRISHYIEKEIGDFKRNAPRGNNYDYNILKSGAEYSTTAYNKIKKIVDIYAAKASGFIGGAEHKRVDNDSSLDKKQMFIDSIAEQCAADCPDENQLTDILLDIVYGERKSQSGIAWEICGDTIVKNLMLKKNKITYPVRTNDDYDFEYNGHGYRLKEVEINEDFEITE